MQDAKNLCYVLAHTINCHEREAGKYQFAGAFLASRSSTERKLCQGINAFINAERKAAGSLWAIMLFGVIANACEVVSRWLCPANPHLAGKPAVNQLADLLMVNHLASVGGGQPRLHLTHKPLVVVNEPLYRLLGKRLRVAASLGGDAGKFGLGFWI